MTRNLVALVGDPGSGRTGLGRAEVGRLVREAWDDGEAVAVMDTSMPPAALHSRITELAATHVVDSSGRRQLPSGSPVDADVVAVVSTSGTTGTPSAVTLTEAGMRSMALGVSEAHGAGESSDTWLCCLPLHHVAGLGILARHHLNGGGLVFHEAFDPDAVARAPRESGATIVSLVPTMLHRMLQAGVALDGYRVLRLGGGAVPEELRRRAADVGGRVVATYGMTETWGGCVHNGVANAGVNLRIGESGEIQVQGAVVTPGYHRDPERTRAAFTADGWLRTGDVGTLEAGGSGSPERLHVTDRLKDIIISGGVNVSPVAVESVLADHPGVADVAVVGIADTEWGERVVAHVVPMEHAHAPGLEELREFGARSLPATSLPREVRIAQRIPRTAGGKIRRIDLRE